MTARRQLCASALRVFTKLRLGATAIATQLAAWAIQTLAAYAILHALDLQGKAGLAAAAAILLAVNITALVPVTPSNIGIFQATTIAVLTAYGIDASRAIAAYGILLQAVEITTAIALGVPALVGERMSLGDIRHYATATPTPLHESQPVLAGIARSQRLGKQRADCCSRCRRRSRQSSSQQRDCEAGALSLHLKGSVTRGRWSSSQVSAR